jgi:hypothetical protein
MQITPTSTIGFIELGFLSDAALFSSSRNRNSGNFPSSANRSVDAAASAVTIRATVLRGEVPGGALGGVPGGWATGGPGGAGDGPAANGGDPGNVGRVSAVLGAGTQNRPPHSGQFA